MQDHYDREIVFNDTSEFSSLYKWSLHEREGGEKKGSDFIPWEWTLYFKATEIVLHDNFSVGDRYLKEGEKSGVGKSSRYIRASMATDERGRFGPRYSMFGTDRVLSDFVLWIQPDDEDKGERCICRGHVSYTSEVDFRDETHPDHLSFYFSVSRDRFEQFAERVRAGDVDHLLLRLGDVSGFYAPWSPGISADAVKVLTSDKSHVVQSTKDETTLPRLGEVGEAELYLSRRLDLKGETKRPDALDDEDSMPQAGEPLVAVPSGRSEAVSQLPGLALLRSVQRAAWIIAFLLLIILIRQS